MNKGMLLQSLALYEANMAKLAAKVDGGRKARSKKLTYHYTGINRNSAGDAVIEFSVPSQSDPNKSYDCYMAVIPKGMSLFAVAHNQRRLGERLTAIKNADVKCFCTCPDFNWAGMKYNMKHKYDSYEDGHTSVEGVPDGADIPPKHRDPKGRNTLCKHLMAMCKGILTNATSIMGDARKAKFPAQTKSTPTSTTVLNKKPQPSATNNDTSKVNVLNNKVDAEPSVQTASDLKVLNGNDGQMDKPSETEAIQNLSSSEPIQTPETNAVIGALAGTLSENSTEKEADAVDNFSNNDDNNEDDEENTSDMKVLNGYDNKSNPSFDFDDSPNLPMFDQPID